MYAIGTASRLSGVPVETIRIWERRYGKPAPRRSEGGHRQYSDEDVLLLRALKALTDSGVRIGALAGQDPAVILAAAAALDEREAPKAAAPSLNDLVYEALEAGRAGDAARLSAVLDRPLRVGHPADVVLGLYLPLLRVIGDHWEAGKLEVATEHFIEKQVTARLHGVITRMQVASGPLAVLACLPGERHEGGLLAAGVLLSQHGYRLKYFGADLPVAELLAAVLEEPPALLVLSAVVPPPPEVIDEVRGLVRRDDLQRMVPVVGGQAAPSVGDDRLLAVKSLDELPALVRRLPRDSAS